MGTDKILRDILVLLAETKLSDSMYDADKRLLRGYLHDLYQTEKETKGPDKKDLATQLEEVAELKFGKTPTFH